jgi:hypothetical protein
MESGLPGWDGSRQREGLFVWAVYRVRLPSHTPCAARLLTRPDYSEFDW